MPQPKEVVDLINLQEDRGTRVSQLIKDSGMVQQSLCPHPQRGSGPDQSARRQG